MPTRKIYRATKKGRKKILRKTKGNRKKRRKAIMAGMPRF